LARDLGQHAPTAEQAAVIAAPLAPTLVVAGAGAGKTNTMAARVVYLVANGKVEPGHILGLTFTRKAAGELSDRINSQLSQLDRLAGRDAFGVQSPTVATYNSYAASLVQDHALRLGIDPDSQIMTPGAQWQLATEVVEDSDLPVADKALSTLVGLILQLAAECIDNNRAPAQVAEEFEAIAEDLGSKEAGVSPDTGHRRKRPSFAVDNVVASLRQRGALMGLVERYLDLKRQRGLMDYADQVSLAVKLVDRFEMVGQSERNRFQAVLLDEYQDTSALQIRLMQRLFKGHPVMAVGDPNQAIYGWRGASAEGLAGFPEHFGIDGQAGHPTQSAKVLTLSTAWRNDHAVLAAANVISAPLRRSLANAFSASSGQDIAMDLPELTPKTDAGQGEVTASYFTNQAEEAHTIAEYLSREWYLAAPVGSRRRTAAVLCRTRAAFGPVVAALKAAGLPHEVVGMGGLVEMPEVQDVLAALKAAQDPDHPEALLRLAAGSRFALGLKDLSALGTLARQLGTPAQVSPEGADQDWIAGEDAKRSHKDQEAAAERPVMGENPPTIIDALAQLEPELSSSFTAEGYRRLKRLGQVLSRIRAGRHLPIPGLILQTERILGIDIDLLARHGSAGRVHIDQLVSTAQQFLAGGGSGLGHFLDWIELEAAQDRGLALGQVTANDRAVQVMTIHAAKGLEWDVVVVSGLGKGKFPAVDQDRQQGWFKDFGYLSTGRGAPSNALPWPLRLDAAALPRFDHAAATDVIALSQAHVQFIQAAGQYALAEERRLAYVAMIRARSHVLLTGSWWLFGRKGAVEPSIFLNELVEAGLVDTANWCPKPVEEQNPAQTTPRQGAWPPDHPLGSREAAVMRAAGLVTAELGGTVSFEQAIATLAAIDSDLAAQALMLLREQAQRRAGPVLELPQHLSVTAADQLLRQPADYALQVRRPLPAEPSQAALLGQLFHAQVESLLRSWSGQEALALAEEWQPSPDSAAGRRLDALVANFRQSWWSDPANGLRLVDTEQSLATTVAGCTLRGRADAIFRDVNGALVIVDWKTGGLASKEGQPKAEHLDQLELYRAMLAQLRDIPIAEIKAAVYYASVDRTCWLDPPGLDNVLDLLAARLPTAKPANI